MTRGNAPALAVIVVFVLPLVWSAGLAFSRRCLGRGRERPDDALEKLMLLILLAPAGIGLSLAVLVPIVREYFPGPVLSLPALPLPDFDDDGGMAVAARAAGSAAAFHPILAVSLALIVVYASVAGFLALRLGMAQLKLGWIVAQARRDLLLGRDVRITAANVPPLAWGRHAIVLPASLVAAFAPVQIDLILRHESVHLCRGDGLWFAILAWIEVIFWFNPFIRSQARRCRLAAELACDDAVVRAVPDMQHVYAQTLVMTLKHTAGNALPISTQSGVPAVFSPEKSGDYRMRIREIMHPTVSRRKPRYRWLYAVAAALVVPLAAAQFAWSQGGPVAVAAVVAAPKPAMAPVRVASINVPPISVPMTNPYGDRINPFTHKPDFHHGIDFRAPIGTPVVAAGDGTVTLVANWKYGMGKLVEVDHGGTLRTRYAHLDSVAVKVGDHVSAGQLIAASGNTGQSTGPHLHFEVWQNGAPINPVTVVPVATAP